MNELTLTTLNDRLNCSEAKIHAGIDEAGRGPVIGPMVMAVVEAHVNDIPVLQKIGIKDSKRLAPKKREEIYNKLLQLDNRVIVATISPRLIDEWVLNGNGLNALEAYVVAKLINSHRICANMIYLDAPSNSSSYKSYLEKYGITSKKLVVDTHAEEKWIIVAAASIIAKVTRDNEINQIKKIVGLDFGSGYPSDPKTRAALKIIIKKFPEYVRKSWKTVRGLSNPVKVTLDKYTK